MTAPPLLLVFLVKGQVTAVGCALRLLTPFALVTIEAASSPKKLLQTDPEWFAPTGFADAGEMVATAPQSASGITSPRVSVEVMRRVAVLVTDTYLLNIHFLLVNLVVYELLSPRRLYES
jgi:hypothetical protein